MRIRIQDAKSKWIRMDPDPKHRLLLLLFLRLFLGDLQYFIVTPHWLCINLRRPIRLPHRFCSAKGPPGCPGRGSNPRPTEWQAGLLTIELRLTQQ